MATGGTSSTRLYTRTGDLGTTGLVGGARVGKDSPRIRSFGSLDELGAQLGVAAANLPDGLPGLAPLLVRLQHELSIAQSELATPPGASAPAFRILARHVTRLESEIDQYSATFEPLHTFVLPRGGRGGAHLHLSRTIARRAEREMWSLHASEPLTPELLQWINRLSDLLFALALSVNRHEGFRETAPDYTV
ncbi:MAG: cob(I)yrinic acid a,c-diamide adenosyltransferase [Thermoplasmata archaeon]|nr:cob(I)yrinic acid a,c-diamide adenosyltransferase [Thermoplasmata archaeon]